MSDETPVSVTMQKDGDVAVVVVNNPPVNALSWHVRQGLKDNFEAALADDGVKAIVLRCDGGTFIAGADISEFGKPPRGPDFNAVLNMIEAATKPVAVSSPLVTFRTCSCSTAPALSGIRAMTVSSWLAMSAGSSTRPAIEISAAMAGNTDSSA